VCWPHDATVAAESPCWIQGLGLCWCGYDCPHACKGCVHAPGELQQLYCCTAASDCSCWNRCCCCCCTSCFCCCWKDCAKAARQLCACGDAGACARRPARWCGAFADLLHAAPGGSSDLNCLSNCVQTAARHAARSCAAASCADSSWHCSCSTTQGQVHLSRPLGMPNFAAAGALRLSMMQRDQHHCIQSATYVCCQHLATMVMAHLKCMCGGCRLAW
jgi:hypothetical protein